LHFILRKIVEPDGCVDSFWEINHPVLGLYIAIIYMIYDTYDESWCIPTPRS
jgi:hypothetical protein